MPDSPFTNVEAEVALLRSMMVTRRARHAAAQIKEADFSDTRHQVILRAIRKAEDKDLNPQPDTLIPLLKEMGLLQQAGTATYVRRIKGSGAVPSGAEEYVRILSMASHKRRLVRICEDLIDRTARFEGTKAELQGLAERLIFSLSDAVSSEELTPIGDAVNEAIRRMEEAQRAEGLVGLPTGLTELDDLYGGWKKSELIILAARPGVGKSSAVTGFIVHQAQEGHHILTNTLEMPAYQYAMRSMAQAGRFNLHEARMGRLSDEDWQRATRAAGRLSNLPIWIDDFAGATVEHIRGQARRLHSEYGLDAVYVDFLQIMKGEGETRRVTVGNIARELKDLALELDIPVIGAAQLSRANTGRSDPRPVLTDLKETGDLEEASDSVVFIHRDEYYDIDVDMETGQPTQGRAEFIVAKHRNGPTDMARCGFIAPYTAFVDWHAYLQWQREQGHSPPSPQGDGAPAFPTTQEDPF